MLTGVLVGSIFSALLMAFGLYRLYQYYKFYQHVHSGSAWPETAGTVVDGHVVFLFGFLGVMAAFVAK
jgi:hypothetical protein